MTDYGTRNEETTEARRAAESVIERVYLSVEQLCTGPGDVRDRLRTVIVTLISLREEDFPEELRDDFRWVIESSTKFESQYPEYRGNLDETMSRIRNTSGQKIAKKIFHIYSRLQDIRGFPLLEYRHPDD